MIRPGGYVKYQVVIVSQTNFTIVPFNIDLGQILNGTIGSSSTSFSLDTTSSTGPSDYTFRLINYNQLSAMQAFYLVMNVSGITVSLGWDTFAPQLCQVVNLAPGVYNVTVDINYETYGTVTNNVMVSNLQVLQIEGRNYC